MKIIHERDKCIGCGSCVAICPKYWEMNEDGKSDLKGFKLNPKTNNQEKEVEKAECNQDAVEACPVQCIHIEK